MNESALPVTLAMSGRHHLALQAHLFPGDGREAVAFALCGRGRRPHSESLLVRDIIKVPHADCERSPHRVTWPGTALDSILTQAINGDMALVKIHSHPTGYPWFSDTDDAADAVLFPSVYGWLGDTGPMASAIMMPNGSLVGRAIHDSGIGDPLQRIRVAGDDFMYWPEPSGMAVSPSAMRIAQTFGEGTYARLRGLKIGVVGCSGTGSIVAEQLARNGVGAIVLIDPDVVEDKNLNRILNSTANDAEAGTPKTEVLRRAIAAMGMGTEVVTHACDLMDRNALLDLSSCDVVFGCMDSVDGRHVLNKLATAYLIPYIDVGVRLDADGQGDIASIWLAVHTLQPGGSSLKSRRVYDQADLEAAFLRRTSPREFERMKKQGYIKGVAVDRPAVISVNMQAAAMAVNEFLARIHGYRNEPNSSFAVRRACLNDDEAGFSDGDGAPCLELVRMVGRGDQSPFLGMPSLGA